MRPGEPTITRRAVHDSGTGNLPVRRIVIHATCPPRVPWPDASKSGTAAGTAKYFQSTASGGSAHYVYDAGRHEEHPVPEAVIAWHSPPNSHSIGIEICGQSTYTRQQWLSPEVWPAVQEAAARTAELCRRHSIPARRLTVAQVKAGAAGVCGHVDVSEAFRQSDHTDPGPHFPWAEFMALVTGAQEEDDMTGEAVYQAVWDADEMVVPWGSATNPKWKPKSVLVDIGAQVRAVRAQLDAQNVTIKAMAEALAARDPEIDVQALVGRIEAAIEGITVRLDVPDAPTA